MEYLYANYSLLVSKWAHWIHRDFDVLAELFDQFGVRTNVGKTGSMAFQSCCTVWGHSTESYSLRMTREVLFYCERFYLWVL